MEFDSPLTMTGLIATILGMVFALAAYTTSRRKQALKAVQLTSKTDETITTLPENEVIENHLADPKQVNAKTTEGSAKRPVAVFKQVGPQGSEVATAAHYADDEYIWE